MDDAWILTLSSPTPSDWFKQASEFHSWGDSLLRTTTDCAPPISQVHPIDASLHRDGPPLISGLSHIMSA